MEKYWSFTKKYCGLVICSTLSLLLFLVSCSEDETDEEKILISQITIDSANPLSLVPGQDFLVNYTILPENATEKTIVWSSEDDKIASVDDKGCITANAIGNVTITATPAMGDATPATLRVNVIEEIIYAENITITYDELVLGIDGILQLNAVLQPLNVTYKTIKWESSDESVATVSPEGLVTAVSDGNVYITASATDGSNVTDKVLITVEPIPLTAIQEIVIQSSSLGELALYEVFRLDFSYYPEDATVKSINWHSENPEILNVGENTLITAAAYGTTELVAIVEYIGGYTDEFRFATTIVEGKINDLFNEYNNLWIPFNEQALLSVQDNKLVITSVEDKDSKYKIRFKRSVVTQFHTVNYPIIAIKSRYNGVVTDSTPNYVVDVWGGDITGGKYGTNASPYDNMPVIPTADGCVVHYFDTNPDTGLGFDGYKMSPGINNINNVIYEVWQIISEDGQAPTLDVYWVKSFKSIDELNTYLDNE